MKQYTALLLTAGFLFIIASSLSSCGADPAETISGTEAPSHASSAPASSSGASNGAGHSERPSSKESAHDPYAIKKYATMEEYVASDSVREEEDTLNKTLKENGMELTISARQNQYVYTYRMTQDIDTSKMVKALEKLLDEQTDSFTVIANALKYKVDVESPVIVVRYLDINGNEFITREYAAE